MESENLPDPAAETPFINGVAAGMNENNNTTGSSDNMIEPPTDHDDEATLSDDSIAPVPSPFRPGDYVQWESNGLLRMPEAKRLSHFSDDGNFAFIEGSDTGIPADELIAADSPVQAANETAITAAATATEAGIDLSTADADIQAAKALEPEAATAPTVLDDSQASMALTSPSGGEATLDADPHDTTQENQERSLTDTALTAIEEANGITRFPGNSAVEYLKDQQFSPPVNQLIDRWRAVGPAFFATYPVCCEIGYLLHKEIVKSGCKGMFSAALREIQLADSTAYDMIARHRIRLGEIPDPDAPDARDDEEQEKQEQAQDSTKSQSRAAYTRRTSTSARSSKKVTIELSGKIAEAVAEIRSFYQQTKDAEVAKFCVLRVWDELKTPIARQEQEPEELSTEVHIDDSTDVDCLDSMNEEVGPRGPRLIPYMISDTDTSGAANA